jgi:hypothetical protein
MSIYVEILVRAPMDAVWAHTQLPSLHERWDLRFSRIEYLAPAEGGASQRFRYATRIGLGFEVVGEGETTRQRDLPDGSSTSALKFTSDAPLSIIRKGSGYWKYIPTRDGVRLLTWYDYRTRFGAAGAVFERMIFRPLIGWATAWSFDRLRLWVDEHIDPRVAVRHLHPRCSSPRTCDCIRLPGHRSETARATCRRDRNDGSDRGARNARSASGCCPRRL